MTIRKSGVFAALVCAVLVGCTVASREVGSASDVRPIKVLMIGNSFSISTLRYLPKLAEAEGRPLDLASLYIGGCELKRHWANVVAAEADPSKGTYQYDRTTCGKLAESRKTSTIPAALKADKWDIVTIQQASHESWRAESFQPWADNLIAKINELAPRAKIYVQQTWSYSKWDSRIARDPRAVGDADNAGTWGFDQEGMYERARTNYLALAVQNGFEVIPTGDAVQNYRREVGFDVMADCVGYPPPAVGKGWHDTIHLNRAGEYLQALVWYGKIFNTDPRKVGYVPDTVTPSTAAQFRNAAAEALGFDVTYPVLRGVSPAGDCVIELVPTNQLALFAVTSHVERMEMLRADHDGDRSRFGKDNVWRDAAPLKFRWEGPADCAGTWMLQVSKEPDFAKLEIFEVFSRWDLAKLREKDGIVLWEHWLKRPNLELGTTYYWRVISNVKCNVNWDHGRHCDCTNRIPERTMATAAFRTGWQGSRWIKLEGRVDNFRDIGGRMGKDGRRYHQGLVYRAQGFNDNSETGEDSEPGRNRLTMEDVKFLTDKLGIRTELDLRGPREVAGMGGISPMGEKVKWVNRSSASYKKIFEPWGKDAMAENFRVFTDADNFPVYFHCIAGADRTGALGIVLLGVAGVERDLAIQDWEATFYPYGFSEIRPEAHWRDLTPLTEGLDAYGEPGDSFMRKCELYLMDCGVTPDEIEAYRDIVLEKE